MQPHNVEVQAEQAEVKHLQQQQLALAVGLAGLQIEQSYGKQRQQTLFCLKCQVFVKPPKSNCMTITANALCKVWPVAASPAMDF
jgi:hypothetical protein